MIPGAAQITIGDVMTRDVLAIDANDTLDVIAGLFDKYDYDGMPVVDANHTLLGVITTRDLIMHLTDQGVGIHLPTLLRLLSRVAGGMGDTQLVSKHFGILRDTKATSIMGTTVIRLPATATLEEAVRMFADHPQANPICVVDQAGKLVGVVSRADTIKAFSGAFLSHPVTATQAPADLRGDFPTRSGNEVLALVKEIQEDFLIVRRTRPLIWKYIAFATFIAGLIAAAILVIHVAQRLG